MGRDSDTRRTLKLGVELTCLEALSKFFLATSNKDDGALLGFVWGLCFSYASIDRHPRNVDFLLFVFMLVGPMLEVRIGFM